ncbi:MAG: 6-phosphogluconolactonase [Muriicola sp.]|nr:6-phosphogluconolactonase [Muriicola sp.]NNC61281.1 6-phosphogluconolactonase [Eudoraea sp.]NNK19867.1 6-phosphogluconolactonase [Flavobacteriaceae bacterium]NNK34523.1 6-phosphogluconolactonase [Eudoraea sp.]
MKLNIYPTKNEVAIQFCVFLTEWLKDKKSVHIALSGGSTPKIIFEELSIPGKYAINWNEVHLYWGDERCVPPNDDQSNYKMTKDFLLDNIDIPLDNIHRILGENDPREEALRYGQELQRNLPVQDGIPKFDMVLLGMGEDGHTASVFPHEIHLWDSDQNCELAVHPDSGQKRITITGRIINHSKNVVFLVTGDGKKEKVAEILGKKGNYKQYPAALVSPDDGNLYWFLDEPAASGIRDLNSGS